MPVLLLFLSLVLSHLVYGAVARVVPADDLSSIQVTFEAGSGALELQDQSARQSITVLENGRWSGRRLVPQDTSVPLGYRADLTHNGAQWGISQWHAPLRLADWHDWLLTPVSWRMTRPIDLFVTQPKEGDLSLPFERQAEQDSVVRYRAYPILPGHGGFSMFGNLQTRTLKKEGNRIEVTVVGDSGEEADLFFRWVEGVLDTAVEVHGAAPGHATIFLVPIPFVRGVAPWAYVRRGGGSHIIAYVREGLTLEELNSDWTLFHEVTHLYHPYLHSGGRWVSEGFASYFQNVYQARAGVVTPDYALGRLSAGLERGRKENVKSGYRPVTEGGRMRVYWTGAALAYQADARLHESGQANAFARAMGTFANRHMPTRASWHPRDYLSALDEELNDPLLVELYDEYARDRYFPEPEMSPGTWQLIFGTD
ncbi:MAG: hypothetical protein JJ934_04795 [Pseudomonadales bacterium]|nr:hypothetical protein [Pseudomonadales bacterium]